MRVHPQEETLAPRTLALGSPPAPALSPAPHLLIPGASAEAGRAMQKWCRLGAWRPSGRTCHWHGSLGGGPAPRLFSWAPLRELSPRCGLMVPAGRPGAQDHLWGEGVRPTEDRPLPSLGSRRQEASWLRAQVPHPPAIRPPVSLSWGTLALHQIALTCARVHTPQCKQLPGPLAPHACSC